MDNREHEKDARRKMIMIRRMDYSFISVSISNMKRDMNEADRKTVLQAIRSEFPERCVGCVCKKKPQRRLTACGPLSLLKLGFQGCS